MKLSKKVVIITGGGGGLGKTYALGMSAEGARVVVADIKYGAAQEVANEIIKQGGEALALETDVTSETSANEMAKKTVEVFGAIDVLVNNAALYGSLTMTAIEDLSIQEWDKVMTVNLRGIFLSVKAVLPQMKKQSYGKIINISSNTVFSGIPLFSHYVTSKAGVIGFTRSVARELGPFGICVNAITPGLTDTEAARKVIPAERFPVVNNLRSLRKVQSPKDLLGIVIFLASDDSNFITGQTINVDGGQCFY